jgi:PAS domain S-box-containing protein
LDGVVFYCLVRSQPIRLAESGQATVDVILDITERKRADELLRLERDLGMALSRSVGLEELLDIILDAVFRLDDFHSGGIYLEDEHRDGLTLANHRGLDEDFVRAAAWMGADAPQTKLIRCGKPRYFSDDEIPGYSLARKYFGPRYLAFIPVTSQAGVIGALIISSKTRGNFPQGVCNLLEATAAHIGSTVEKVHADAHLRETEENLRRSFEDSANPILRLDPDSGVVLNGNAAAEKLFGRRKEELIDEHYSLLSAMWSEDGTTKERLPFQYQQDGRAEEIHIRTATKEVRVVQPNTSLLYLHGRQILQVVFHDVTALRKAEEERARLFTAIEQSPNIVIITDAQGKIQYVNPAFTRISGYERAEVLNLTPAILRSGKQEETYYQSLWKTIRRGEVWQGHFLNRKKDGGLWEEESTISPVFDAAGNIINYVAIQYDVTARKELERRLQHAQKMESLGTFASGMAHDFKNYLAIISGYTEMALNALGEEDSVRQLIQRSMNATQRARSVSDRVLTFGRRDDADLMPIHLEKTIEEALELIRPSLKTNIDLQVSLDGEGHFVLADAGKIHQIMTNLCSNACQAMETRQGLLSVEVGSEEMGSLSPYDITERPNTRYVRLTVRDTGSGIEEGMRKKVFEPFFTTRKRKGGTGLGLSIVERVTADCGGEIEVESVVGKGSAIHVYFPELTGEIELAEEESIPVFSGNARVLLVDDDEEVVEMNREGLTRLGYKVFPFSNSLLALEAFQAASDAYDVVITDHIMPELLGLQLARKVRLIRSDIPIVVVSGTDEDLSVRVAQAGVNEYLCKPVTPNGLSHVIHRLLGSAT